MTTTNKTRISFDIFATINKELDDFSSKTIQLAGKTSTTNIKYLSKESSYAFSQKDMISLVDLYWNSKFESGEKDAQGRQKLFMNVGKFRSEVASKQIDIDVKDFLFIPTDYASTTGAWLMQQEFKEYSKESYFGELINEAVDALPKYGTVVFKKVGKELAFVPLQTLRNDQTAKSLDEAEYVIEEHPEMSMSEIESMSVKGWKLDGFHIPLGDTVTVYERTGFVPLWYLNSLTEKETDGDDRNKLVDALIICAMDTTPRSKKNKNSGHIFYATEISERPYREAHWSKQHGRWLGIGEMENQIPNQIAKNVIINILKNSFEWSSKRVFQSSDEEVANSLAHEVQDGDVLQVSDAGRIAQVDMTSRFGGEAQHIMNDWEKNSDQKSFTYDVATGQTMPSGTPFRLGVVLSNSVNSHFALKQEKLAMFLKRSIVDFLIPEFKKKAISGKSVVLMNSDAPGFNVLRAAAEDYTKSQVIKASILSGKLIDMNLIQQLVDPIATANQIFVKRASDYYGKINTKFSLVITGEETEVQKKITSLTTLYQVLASRQDPRAEKVLERILALTGENMSLFGGAKPALLPGAEQPAQMPQLPKEREKTSLDIPETTQNNQEL